MVKRFNKGNSMQRKDGPMLRPVKIASLATYVPPRVMTNHDLEKLVDTSSNLYYHIVI